MSCTCVRVASCPLTPTSVLSSILCLSLYVNTLKIKQLAAILVAYEEEVKITVYVHTANLTKHGSPEFKKKKKV